MHGHTNIKYISVNDPDDEDTFNACYEASLRNFLNSRVATRCSGPNLVLVKQPQYIFSVKTVM